MPDGSMLIGWKSEICGGLLQSFRRDRNFFARLASHYAAFASRLREGFRGCDGA